MRNTTMTLLALLLLSACGAGPEEPVQPVPDTVQAPRLDYAGKQRIPVRLDLAATADGGRVVAIAGAWRGEVAFDGGTRTTCGTDRGGRDELAPGGSYEVRLVCTGAVQLPDDGRRGFRVLEDGRQIGAGVVLP